MATSAETPDICGESGLARSFFDTGLEDDPADDARWTAEQGSALAFGKGALRRRDNCLRQFTDVDFFSHCDLIPFALEQAWKHPP